MVATWFQNALAFGVTKALPKKTGKIREVIFTPTVFHQHFNWEIQTQANNSAAMAVQQTMYLANRSTMDNLTRKLRCPAKKWAGHHIISKFNVKPAS